MSAIRKAFEGRRRDSMAVIPYVTCGFPDAKTTEEILVQLGEAGAAVVEIGVPFSDPMADGLVIQRACEHALANGMTLEKVLATIKSARQRTDVPVVLFSYLNPLLRYGLQKLVDDAADAGVSGVLVTDLPTELAGGFAASLRTRAMDLIALVAPTSTDERLRAIAGRASGFLYAVSRTGVTGTRNEIGGDARDLVSRVRKFTKLPVALGFGISTVEQAREASTYADAVVVGSALMKVIGESPRGSEAENAGRYIQKFTSVQAAIAATEK
jgi:tryptophan synthase alpha chain